MSRHRSPPVSCTSPLSGEGVGESLGGFGGIWRGFLGWLGNDWGRVELKRWVEDLGEGGWFGVGWRNRFGWDGRRGKLMLRQVIFAMLGFVWVKVSYDYDAKEFMVNLKLYGKIFLKFWWELFIKCYLPIVGSYSSTKLKKTIIYIINYFIVLLFNMIYIAPDINNK